MRTRAPSPRKRKAHFYWWTLANTTAACLAVLSWLLCLHVFGHPEIPRNYEILRKLDRQAEPVGFQLQKAPPGDAADPRALYRRYAELSDEAMDRLNAALMRNYLKGLEEDDLIQYVEGDFRVIEIRELGPGDLFSPGFAVRGRAMVQPDEFTEAAPWPVEIEYLFPTERVSASDWFQPGDMLSISRVPNCAMMLHVAHNDGEDTPVVILTAVPIAMGKYRVGAERSFTVSAPTEVRPGAALPVFTGGRG